jgi:hypothetical protein
VAADVSLCEEYTHGGRGSCQYTKSCYYYLLGGQESGMTRG